MPPGRDPASGPGADARRLRQHRQQRGVGIAQPGRRLAEIDPAGCAYPLQRAAKRRAIQVERENVRFREMPFELHCAPHLAQLAAEGARMRVQQARDLHGQRAAAGDDRAGAEILPGRAGDGERVDAGVAPEPAVFIVQQRLKIARRHILNGDGITPDAVFIREAPQRRAVLRHDHACGLHFIQRQRPEFIGNPQRSAQ